jgi:type I protein arginine methyltransferase
MYSISDYASMIADTVRMRAFEAALERAVKPGSVVLDLGTGPGIMALLACRLGARKVYAVDPDDSIELARELARANGFADRIEFIQESSLAVRLPERVDVIVSDLRGGVPLYKSHIPAIADARTRFLAPGGILIPGRDRIRVAPLDVAEFYDVRLGIWNRGYSGLDLGAGHRYAANEMLRMADIAQSQLLAPPQVWVDVDYATAVDPNAGGAVTWTIERPGTAHGIGLWFDVLMADGISFSSAVAGRMTVYGANLLPWPRPVALRSGDVVTVDIQARQSGAYVWAWRTEIRDSGRSGNVRERFAQSNFFATPRTRRNLAKAEAGYRPALGGEGEITRDVLVAMNGAASLEEIAAGLLRRFPERFRKMDDALAFAGELSRKFG